MLRGRQTLIRHHTKASGVGSDYVYQIYPDSKGRVWLATDGAGVTMYDGRDYHKWDGEVGIKVAYSITEGCGGRYLGHDTGKGTLLLPRRRLETFRARRRPAGDRHLIAERNEKWNDRSGKLAGDRSVVSGQQAVPTL